MAVPSPSDVTRAAPLAEAPEASQVQHETVDVDTPSPETSAIYLRPGQVSAPQASVKQDDATTQATESLVDSITRIVTEMLEVHIHESVEAAVRALAPRLVVAFPTTAVSVGDLAQGAEAPPVGADD